MKEFPKCLYLNGDANQDFIVVEDAEAEADAKADGYEAAKPPEQKGAASARRGAKKGFSTAVVSNVATEPAAESPEKGYIYATTGSAPTPGHFNQDTEGKQITKPVDPLPSAPDQEGAPKSGKGK